jgi:hypothetical protein
VAFSPDGKRIFIGNMEDETAKLLDARTGKSLVGFTGYTDTRGLAFSPDGTRIVAGGYTVKVWDAEKGGPPLLDLRGLMNMGGGVSFSPDETRILIGNYDGIAKVLDARTGTPLLTLKGRPALTGPGIYWMQGWWSKRSIPAGPRAAPAATPAPRAAIAGRFRSLLRSMGCYILPTVLGANGTAGQPDRRRSSIEDPMARPTVDYAGTPRPASTSQNGNNGQ